MARRRAIWTNTTLNLVSAKVTFTLAGACSLSCIAYLIDHTLQMRADIFRNLTQHDMSDGLHGSNGINCGNFNTTVLLLLHKNVAAGACTSVFGCRFMVRALFFPKIISGRIDDAVRPRWKSMTPVPTANQSVRIDGAALQERASVCTENLDLDVMVMKSTKDRVRFNASGQLNRTGVLSGWLLQHWARGHW